MTKPLIIKSHVSQKIRENYDDYYASIMGVLESRIEAGDPHLAQNHPQAEEVQHMIEIADTRFISNYLLFRAGVRDHPLSEDSVRTGRDEVCVHNPFSDLVRDYNSYLGAKNGGTAAHYLRRFVEAQLAELTGQKNPSIGRQ